MNINLDRVSGRILVIDDTPAIQQDFKKIFGSGLKSTAALSESEAAFFGTGYSSLSSLKQLPVDTLEIDRSFIRNLDTSNSDEAIVGAIQTLARSLGLHVVAEGVETLAQLQVLGRHGCEVAQGFYFSRPLPAERCRELLVEIAHRSSFTDTLCLRMTRVS